MKTFNANGVRVVLFFLLVIFLGFSAEVSARQRDIDGNWYLPAPTSVGVIYQWQSDPKYIEALSYLVSNSIYDSKWFYDRPTNDPLTSCAFDPNEPLKCMLTTPVRCPRVKSLGGGPDQAGLQAFMDLMSPYGYCHTDEEMIGAQSTTSNLASIFQSEVFTSKFVTPLSGNEAFTLDSEVALPKTLRRTVLGVLKQQMNKVEAMTCQNFAAKRNVIGRPHIVEAPVGHYDCAQKVGGIQVQGQSGAEAELFASPPVGQRGVNFTIRDRGTENGGSCLSAEKIYFDETDCNGHAYLRRDPESVSASFFKFRSIDKTENAVVDLTQYPFGGTSTQFPFSSAPGSLTKGAPTLLRLLKEVPTLGSSGSESTILYRLLREWASGSDTGAGTTPTEKQARKKVVTAYFTEITDRTLYYDYRDAASRRSYRRALKFRDSNATPPSMDHIQYKEAGQSHFIKSFLDDDGSCNSTTPSSALNFKSPGESYDFVYLDPLPGRVEDYAGIVYRPYREVDESTPIPNGSVPADVVKYQAMVANTLESRVYFENLEGLNSLPGGWHSISGSFSGSNDGLDEMLGWVGDFSSASVSENDIHKVVRTVLENNFPVKIRKLNDVEAAGPGLELAFLKRREWWTPDIGADKSGYLRPLMCAPEEQLIAMGRNRKNFGRHADWNKLENELPYCLRYPVTSKSRRNETGNLIYTDVFGNTLPDMADLDNGMNGMSMVCSEDSILVANPPTYSHEANTYAITAGPSATLFGGALSGNQFEADAGIMLERKYVSGSGLTLTIPARSQALGVVENSKPMMQYGLCVRLKQGINHPKFPLGPLALPLRIYINDILTNNFYDRPFGQAPNCP